MQQVQKDRDEWESSNLGGFVKLLQEQHAQSLAPFIEFAKQLLSMSNFGSSILY